MESSMLHGPSQHTLLLCNWLMPMGQYESSYAWNATSFEHPKQLCCRSEQSRVIGGSCRPWYCCPIE